MSMIWILVGYVVFMVLNYLLDRKVLKDIFQADTRERNKRIALEEIVGIKANSYFDINTYNPQIRICDLKEVFNVICPFQIFIDGQIVWDDNQIMEGWTREDVIKFQNQYVNALDRKDIVKKFTFYTVAFHHSVVVIETYKQ